MQESGIAALKVLASGAGADAAFAERFAREARALAKLNHPNIVTVYDFGLAMLLGADPSGERITQARDVLGTPQYMAPEQLEKPLEVDHRADIYSLGVVFYEMLTGELPLGIFAPPSGKVQIDVRLDEVVLRTLAKEPERRYQQAGAVKTDVETIASTPGAALRAEDPAALPGKAGTVWRKRTAGFAVVAALASAGAWYWYHQAGNAVVQVINPPPRLRRGMSARLAFIIAHRSDALRIPVQALMFDMPGTLPGPTSSGLKSPKV